MTMAMTQTRNNGLSVKSLADDEAEIMIYGEIVNSNYWDLPDLITPSGFIAAVKSLDGIRKVTLRINSPGGDVFSAQAIATYMRDSDIDYTAKVDGLSASAATLPMLAANKILIPANGLVMIHNPLAGLLGYYNVDELSKIVDTLGVVGKSIITAYAERTGLTEKQVKKMMADETWMTGEEAVENGFADELMFGDDDEAVMNGNTLMIKGMSFDLSGFRTRPPVAAVIHANKPVAVAEKKQNDGGNDIMDIKNLTADELQTSRPDLVASIVDTAVAQAVDAERERLKAIDEIADSIDADMVAEAKYGETPQTAEALAFNAMKAGKVRNAAFVQALKADADASGANDVKGATAPTVVAGAEKKDDREADQAYIDKVLGGSKK